jgi:zinc protease
VVDERKLLELSSWTNDFTRDPGLFLVSAVLTPSEGAADFDAITGASQRELAQIAAGETPAERIDAVRSNLRYGMLTEVQTPSDVADLLASLAAAGGTMSALDEYLAALAAVTPEEIAQAARTYLVPERRFVVTLAERRESDGPRPENAGMCPEPTTGGAR